MRLVRTLLARSFSFFIIFGMGLLSAPSQADVYHRFWRGTKLDSLSTHEFQAGLNQVFIPKTIQTGNQHGLIAYEPVLVEGTPQAGLPDEIALVSYQDLESYATLFASDPGKAYVALHWQYFDRAQSKSLVPEKYSGTLDFEHAYDLHPQFDGWKNGNTHVTLSLRRSTESDADYLARIQAKLKEISESNAFGLVILVAQKYWIEYLSGDLKANTATGDLFFPIARESAETAHLAPGHGVNVQF